MSPAAPSVFAFSVKMTGRPRIVIGGPWAPLLSQIAEPPVPTLSAIVASSGNVLIEATHTARLSEVGSIRAYILIRFSQTMVLAAWPVSFVIEMAAVALRNPCGSPAPLPPKKAMSS